MANKSLYTKALGRIVATGAKSVHSGRYHVISGIPEKWVVVPDGSVNAVKAFSTQRAAVAFAKQTAARKTGEVVVHQRTGLIRDTFTFA